MTPAQIFEVNSQSSWQAVAALDKISPVVGFPFFHMDMIQLDWLHIMDIGVTLQWLGSIFAFLLPNCLDVPKMRIASFCTRESSNTTKILQWTPRFLC